MLPTPGASNNAKVQSISPDNNQANPSRSMWTGRKKRNLEGEGIKTPSQLQLTRELPNVGEESLKVLTMVESVEQSRKNLTNQINRRMTRVKEKHWDQLRNYPEVSATVRQIEEKWPLLSNLRNIKENMKENLAEFKAGRLMEVDAKQKLLKVKMELNRIDQQLQLYSAVPCMKEIVAADDHESLENQFYNNDIGFHGLQLENTITFEKLQQRESEIFDGLPFLLNDDQVEELVLGNFLEVGGQCTEKNDVTIPVDQDYGSLLAREMLKSNYSSWQSGIFNKDNNSVEVAQFHGLQEALDQARYGETPDYLKRIATLIEVDRGKATKFGHKNIEVLACAAIKEMEDWRTPKEFGCNQLKKWAATLNMSKEQDFEVKFADDMLNNICLAYYAYSMIYGEDGSVHKVARASLQAREMLKCNYSSWQSGLFNKDNNSVEVAHFHGLQEALDETCYGKTPDYLKRIATLIEVDRGKATKFGHKNIEVLVCAAIKEMEDWGTPKESGYNQLKKWAATLSMSKEQDFEVKFAEDMLNNICLACYAYSMIYGENG